MSVPDYLVLPDPIPSVDDTVTNNNAIFPALSIGEFEKSLMLHVIQATKNMDQLIQRVGDKESKAIQKALGLAELHHSARELRGREHCRANNGLVDLANLSVRELRGIGDDVLAAIFHDDAVNHVRSGANQLKVEFTLESFAHNFKVKQARGFLTDRDKVKVTIMFRGREMTHPEKGRDLLAGSVNDRDFFVLPDVGTEVAAIENDNALSADDRVVAGLRSQGPYTSADQAHAVDERVAGHGFILVRPGTLGCPPGNGVRCQPKRHP